MKLTCPNPLNNDDAKAKRKLYQTNLLFIIFDDLRPELSIYGKNNIISPNFERLAARSVVFDHAYSQISVCNPSRNSLLTGLRPDTIGTYGFESSYGDHLIIPTRLKRSGYRTESYGKIRHWDGLDKEVWDDHYNGKWYKYQGEEWNRMNSSVMPDKVKKEESFPDYIFASKGREALKRLSKMNEYFMIAIGFKMPHLAMHMPYKYYNMYRSRINMFNASSAELRFPPSAPSVAYRCCADSSFRYMRQEGALEANQSHRFQYINETLPLTMHQEMMWGYAAMITFVDEQLGRILDAIDELELWSNLTVVLTSDHGMHLGEKGIWEKWSLFDESTHVPLIISHPLSPFMGKHYPRPVELVDIFPTINDLLGIPFNKKYIYGIDNSTLNGRKVSKKKHVTLQGKSLAPVILGNDFRLRSSNIHKRKTNSTGNLMPVLNRNFSVSQTWRCADKQLAFEDSRTNNTLPSDLQQWHACDVDKNNVSTKISIMGYSMRTLDFRYTMYIPFLNPQRIPVFDVPIFAEELYDHRGDISNDLRYKELINLVSDSNYSTILQRYRTNMRRFLWKEVLYLNLTTTFSARDAENSLLKAISN